ncbi:MAG TPA: glycosyltransferase family 2 protein [Acidisarcina sp.]
MKPSVIILTYNSCDSLPATLRAALEVSDDVHVVDSFSRDDTAGIARAAGATVVQHAFSSYGEQRNWAIDTLPLKYAWQLHLDADEVLEPELIASILALPDTPPESGFLLARNLRFLGRILRHGGMSPTWHLRLFRNGVGRCEQRHYDQHFYLTAGGSRQLSGLMVDDVRMSLSEWTARHNRWSDAEVLEVQATAASSHRVPGRALGNAIERKRFVRRLYNNSPLFVRPFGLFFYRFVLRLGFLDGTEGFIFWVLQTFWFRFLIDAKLYEARAAGVNNSDRSANRL